jgi:4-amino-4-deoxy-L-arabinose transferase-like glycosyltransferase
MDRQTFTSRGSGHRLRSTERWIEGLWVFGLLLTALLLFIINLGSLPLSDLGEGTVASVAREIARSPVESGQWLYPTLAGQPYFEHPPLLHTLIALTYTIGGANEWTTRLPGAILTACSVPLLYGISRELFPSRLNAIFSSTVFLTLLPVARYGRLALVEGTALCFAMLALWCLLRSRRDLRWALGVGLGLSLVCLTKGLLSGAIVAAASFAFLAWDTPRLFTSLYWWTGLLLGIAPAASWYIAPLLQPGQASIATKTAQQSLRQLWTAVDGRGGSLFYYFGEIVKFSAPWLLFFPYGLSLAWGDRNWSWAKLVLTWSGIYFVAISLMATKLPWSVLPIYPALALACGMYLARVWNWPTRRFYPRVWSIGLGLFALAAVALGVIFGIFILEDRSIVIVFASMALTLTVTAISILRRDAQFILILFWGTYVSLLLLMTTSVWIWELPANYPVKSLGVLLDRGTPEGQTIYTSFPTKSPALNFYSDRQVVPATDAQLERHWEQDAQPHLLLDRETFSQLNLNSVRTVGEHADWIVMAKDGDRTSPQGASNSSNSPHVK